MKSIDKRNTMDTDRTLTENSLDFLARDGMTWWEKLLECLVWLPYSLENQGVTIPKFISKSKQDRIAYETLLRENSQKWIDSYRKWGSFGWTPIPFARPSMFFLCPDTMAAANSHAVDYCNEENMEKLFNKIGAHSIDIGEPIYLINGYL